MDGEELDSMAEPITERVLPIITAPIIGVLMGRSTVPLTLIVATTTL